MDDQTTKYIDSHRQAENLRIHAHITSVGIKKPTQDKPNELILEKENNGKHVTECRRGMTSETEHTLHDYLSRTSTADISFT